LDVTVGFHRQNSSIICLDFFVVFLLSARNTRNTTTIGREEGGRKERPTSFTFTTPPLLSFSLPFPSQPFCFWLFRVATMMVSSKQRVSTETHTHKKKTAFVSFFFPFRVLHHLFFLLSYSLVRRARERDA
jgi:hypothetical protein